MNVAYGAAICAPSLFEAAVGQNCECGSPAGTHRDQGADPPQGVFSDCEPATTSLVAKQTVRREARAS
jgi:hypothetical protein